MKYSCFLMAAAESSWERAGFFVAAIVMPLLLNACMLDIEKGWMLPPDDAALEEDVEEDETPLSVVQELCHVFFTAWCAYLNTCCSPAERSHEILQGLVAQVGYDCVNPASSSMFRDCVLDLADAVSDGSVLMNDGAVPGCRDAIMGTTSSCLNYNVFVRSYNLAVGVHCADVLIGQVGEGESCGLHDECEPGLYCDETGHCARYVEPGGMCDYAQQCGPGNTCLTGGFCGPPRSYEDECDNHWDCAPMLICDDFDMLCQPLLERGSSCVELEMTCTGLCMDSECRDFCGNVY